jgi:hypothetical protein
VEDRVALETLKAGYADDTRVHEPMSAPRRVFIRLGEVPRLIASASLGDAPALRRVLGARHGGRIGVVLCGVLASLATPTSSALAVGIAAYLALSIVASVRYRDAEGLGRLQCLRLMLWTLPVPLVLAIVARLLGAPGALPVLIAAILGYLLLDGGLRMGLRG